MKQYPNILINLKKQTGRCSVLHKVFWVLTGLFLVFPGPVSAQFIRINLAIPAKIGLTDMETFDRSPQHDSKVGLQEQEGTYILAITSAENLQILAKLTCSDSLRNELGEALKFTVSMAYRNDGTNILQKDGNSRLVQFPMSNSGMLIENMKDFPQVLNAYLFIYASTELPTTIKSTYEGDINLKIEYN